MPRRQPKARRGSVIEHVKREAFEPQYFGKAVDDAGDVVKSVFELTSWGHIRLTEARQVGRYHVEAIGQERDQIPEHVAGAREAMEEQKLGRVGCSRLSVEDF